MLKIHNSGKVLEPSGHAGLVVWRPEWSDRDKLNAYLDGERFKVLDGGTENPWHARQPSGG
jgi:hypothetical protein